MQRRDFFKTTLFPIIFSSTSLFAHADKKENTLNMLIEYFDKSDEKTKEDKNIKTIFETIKNDDKKNIITTKQPLFIENRYQNELDGVRKKLAQVQKYVGYGNFNVISFDELLSISKRVSYIEHFTKSELDFMEYVFNFNPTEHGFYGKKISENITDVINKKDIVKISGTGHYLFKGEPYAVYFRMLKDVGDSLILTSGVRSIVKQMKLFLDKIDSVNGNISLASKSLAPPAFTYHSISDFDVGKKGFGHANFTSRFALTNEFIQMRRLKYIEMRYTINNKDGVRYEPWHVKVI